MPEVMDSEKRNISICFFNPTSALSGSERSLIELVKGLMRCNINCLIIIPRQGMLEKELKKRNIPYQVIDYRWWIDPRRNPLEAIARTIYNLIQLIRIITYLKNIRLDLIYSNGSVSPMGAMVSYLLRKPHLWHIREFGDKDFGMKYDLTTTFTRYLIGKLSDYVIVNSKALELAYKMFVSRAKLKVVYNAVDIDTPLQDCNYKKRPDKLILMGSISEGKNQMDAVEAIKFLIENDISVKLTIVGGGDKRYIDMLNNYIRANNLTQYVNIIGFVHGPIKLIDESDIGLITSRAEAFGRVTVEYMKRGKPVIGTKTGGTAELIIENYNGLFYKLNDPIDLMKKIEYLINNPDKVKNMGLNAFKWSNETFSLERYVDDILSVVHDLV